MGTRGAIGFRLDNKDYLTYNHYDSYPSYLGINLLKELRTVKDWNKVKKHVKNIIMIDERAKPTKEQQQKLIKFADITVSSQSIDDWYCLMRNAQGALKHYLNGEVRYMINSNDFILDSLFCEWAYIVNLDTKKLEIWRGFQKKPTPGNRYGTIPESGHDNKYYPCKLIAEYPLSKLPTAEDFDELEKRYEGD